MNAGVNERTGRQPPADTLSDFGCLVAAGALSVRRAWWGLVFPDPTYGEAGTSCEPSGPNLSLLIELLLEPTGRALRSQVVRRLGRSD